MSCECLGTPICLEAWVNPCSTGTYIGLTATQTGTWTMRLEFNNGWKYFGVEVVNGQQIAILTSLLNENYVHQLRVYNTTQELINCYKLKTHYTTNAANAPVPPVADGAWDWASVASSGDTVISSYFTGDLSPIIWLDSNPIEWAAQGITQDAETGTLDLTDIGGYTGTIIFQYRNLNP